MHVRTAKLLVAPLTAGCRPVSLCVLPLLRLQMACASALARFPGARIPRSTSVLMTAMASNDWIARAFSPVDALARVCAESADTETLALHRTQVQEALLLMMRMVFFLLLLFLLLFLLLLLLLLLLLSPLSVFFCLRPQISRDSVQALFRVIVFVGQQQPAVLHHQTTRALSLQASGVAGHKRACRQHTTQLQSVLQDAHLALHVLSLVSAQTVSAFVRSALSLSAAAFEVDQLSRAAAEVVASVLLTQAAHVCKSAVAHACKLLRTHLQTRVASASAASVAFARCLARVLLESGAMSTLAVLSRGADTEKVCSLPLLT